MSYESVTSGNVTIHNNQEDITKHFSKSEGILNKCKTQAGIIKTKSSKI